jgi:hypothetical protein
MALLLQISQKLSQGFSVLWSRYPNKSAKKDALKAYGQVVTTPEIDAEVHRGLDWQIPHWETLEWYHPPYLATYLRQERFRDEPPPPKKVTVSPTIGRRTEDAIKHQNVTAQIQFLVQRGMSLEEAKRQVYKELKWIKE